MGRMVQYHQGSTSESHLSFECEHHFVDSCGFDTVVSLEPACYEKFHVDERCRVY